ncbi:MAG: protein kinase [Gemmatimonadota bacterium]|nr:MAG: protein kinase [Gemmatimonadota bacterium]
MFCSRCGTEVQDTAKFCPSCGLDLAATTPLAAIRDPSDDTEVSVVKNALKEEYEIVQELGRGGMAIVYKARERELERDVAIKVLPFSLAFDAEFVERFQREARTSAKLEHPNIIPIYRVGRSGRVIFFVMKFLRGESLSEQLEKRGALPPEEINKILCQTAAALGYAHKNGIVHRDIKPDNIMFDESGHAILTDFGIAKAATGTRLTGTGMSIGTPHYMSPEQARAQTLDGRSDIYSLGVVAYQCLTGVVPFDGEDSFSIGYKHIMEELPEPELRTAAQRSLLQVIRRMMAKTQEERFQTAEDLVAALEGAGPMLARGPAAGVTEAPRMPPPPVPTPVGTPPRGVSPSTPTTPMPRAARPSFQIQRKKKKKSGVLVGLMLILLLGGGGAGGYWYFILDAQWPLPFMSQAVPSSPATMDTSSSLNDSLLLVASDTGQSASDSAAVDDTTGGVEEPAADLPSTGMLILTNIPRGAQVTIDGEPITGDTLELEPRSYKIEALRTGYEKFEMTQAVGRGEVVVVPVNMTRVVEQAPPPEPPPVDVCTVVPPPAEYFEVGRCFDTRASELRAPIVNVPPDYQGELRPLRVLVRVSVNGNPAQVLQTGSRETAGPPELQIMAQRFIRDSLRFQPATKGGQPIEAWRRVTVQFRRR